MGKRSFTDYIKSHFKSLIENKVADYIEEEYDELDLNTTFQDIDRVECEGVEIIKVRPSYAEDMAFLFDVDVRCEVVVYEDSPKEYYQEFCPWVTVKCKGNLAKPPESWRIGEIVPYEGKDKKRFTLSDLLVPIIYAEQYEEVAEQFLKANYPEALDQPLKVDPLSLMERMKLKVEQHSISRDCSVFGQTYFATSDAIFFNRSTGKEEYCHIESGTIVYDPESYWLFSKGKVNNTIVHECVHWYLHRKAFLFERLFNKEITKIGCKVVGEAEADATGELKFMEIQANAIAPRILMPFQTFRMKANELISSYSAQGNLAIDIMPTVIDELACFFDVSREAAKVRLAQVGYLDEVRGSYVYMDGHYVQPHRSKKRGFLGEMQTFCIPEDDASILGYASIDLYAKLREESYIFVDNHFVRNKPEYVEADRVGRKRLTEYARLNMEECCLVFELAVVNGPDPEYHTICVLNQDKDSGFKFEIRYPAQCNTQSKQAEYEKELVDRQVAVIGKMGRDRKSVFKVIHDEYKVNYTELGRKLDIDEKTIRNAFNCLSVPSKETLVLICLGLHLPPHVSNAVLEITNNKLQPLSDENDRWYDFALMYRYSDSIESNREFLNRHNIRI